MKSDAAWLEFMRGEVSGVLDELTRTRRKKKRKSEREEMENDRIREIIKGLKNGVYELRHCPVCGHRLPKDGEKRYSREHEIEICPMCKAREELAEFIGAESTPLQNWWLARHPRNVKIKKEYREK
jgi:hypothetical protein